MPANLPPQYLEAERQFRQARTPAEKIQAIEAMLAVIPKHKGTEKLIGDLRRRISKLKEETEKKGGPKRGALFSVEREGAGQVALVGPPNVGKSMLLSRLTHATPEVADYPFTTRTPLPGMMPFEDIKIQLVDLPPLFPGHTEHWIGGIVRNADLVLLVVDLVEGPLEQVEMVLGELERMKIWLMGRRPEEPPRGAGIVVKKAVLVGNKGDGKGAVDHGALLVELYGDRFPVFIVSARERENLEGLMREIYQGLGILRVYTKVPGKAPDFAAPFVLPVGSTVWEVAGSIHKDFVEKLKFARLWRRGALEGMRVPREYLVQDGDVIELHL
ncbi:MAG: 50S ribosome-binding GTPase [candidate division NC10 bacterium]|nr:50S ribosome-binding GTPase [candidate division NC10 bacterium]